MKVLFASTTASALIAGAFLFGAAPAFAQNVDAGNPYFDHAEGTMSTNAGTAVRQSPATSQQFMKMDPRDAKADPNADAAVDSADASNPYFNHAEGTMTGPEAVAQSSTNGQYVATYHQYMRVDPRDEAVPAKQDGNASQEMLYDHAEGTMSR